MPPENFLLLALALAHHATTASDTTPPDRATSPLIRCLNSAGRWAVHGTVASPLLMWPPNQSAAAGAAAAVASKARQQPVEVVTFDASVQKKIGEGQTYTDAFESALRGPASQSSAKARRLRTEADKLEAFCMVVRAASDATDHHTFGDVSRAASKALRAKFGSGSITSAFAWLSDRAGHHALDSVLVGEVELSGPLSLRQVVEATALAQQAELLRDKS